jgi:DNA (cytosine-5)-methyltransferase 1|tara:strand:- start:313 stop:1590 length:1278 start_codon:yes stop_codon:yes gene_type:complete
MYKLTKKELLDECVEKHIKASNSMNKCELIQLLEDSTKKSSSIKSFKFIDLFCGIGGFHQALSKLGGTCVFASDIDKNCRDTYEDNYGIRPHGDIKEVKIQDIPDFDILTGGFPCQSFSNSGKKKGFDDKRGQLYENILEIAKEKQPSYMFLENVKHIKKIDKGEVFKHILFCIKEIGYHVDTFELSPHQLGIPQQRERVIFVCIRNDIYDETKELNMEPPKSPMKNILEVNTDPKYKIKAEQEEILNIWDEMVKVFEIGQSMSPTILCKEFYNSYSKEEFEKLAKWKQEYIVKNKPIYNKYKNEWDLWMEKHRDKLCKLEIYGKLEWQAGPKIEDDSIFNHFIQLRQSGIRVKKTKYFPTLVAIVQTPIYAKERRYITPRECARLQSFPDSFKLHKNDKIAYKQFGNAVNVDVVYFVMSRVLYN